MDKPVLQFALLCDNVIKDETTKKLSFIGIFDEISSKKFPTVHNILYVVTRWNNLSGGTKHKQNFRIISAKDKKEIYNSKKWEEPFPSTDESNSHTIITIINGLGFNQPGSYYINFYLDDIVQSQKIYLKVRLIKE